MYICAMTEDRLMDIEIRLEYQDRTIATLNDVVIAQQAEIESLRLDLAKLHLKLIAPEQSFGPANDKPPHY